MRTADETDALRQSRAVTPDVISADGSEPLGYRRADVPGRVLQCLKRGQYAVQGEIDLHHLTAGAAAALLREFLAQSRDDAHHCVRIVHGKGLHSAAGEPILKRLVERTLSQRADVLAYASVLPGHGGTGATVVLLAKHRSR